jgi:Tfp pilus tip-associated adhesin PilY1
MNHLIKPQQRSRFAPAALALACALLAAGAILAPAAAHADDRSLLENTQQTPYVFIILDTSGSMMEEIACSAADVAAGYCTQECDPGDCLPHSMGDDPDSKIYTAKQAIYDIMQSHPNINFGFGHFDQVGLHVLWKYWWYTVATTQPNGFLTDSATNFTYPVAGGQELFGQQAWNCTDGSPTPYSNVSCIESQPAHLDNAWEMERAHRYPKLGDTNTAAAYTYYVNKSTVGSNPTYKVTYTPVTGQTMGSASMTVSVNLTKCLNSGCTGTGASSIGTKVMTFNLANQTVYWDPPVNLNGTNVPDASGNGAAYFGQNAFEVNLIGTASLSGYDYALDENNNTTNDPWATSGSGCTTSIGTNLCDMGQPNTTDPFGRTATTSAPFATSTSGTTTIFQVGDVIPLDWKSNQQTAIMQRMAPNLLNPANTTPDFGIADYMADHPATGETGFLQVKNVAQRPLSPEGGTPTGHVMMSFADWINGSTWYQNGATGSGVSGSWKTQAVTNSWIGAASASTGDPFFACKPVYVLLLTDGLASSDDGTYTLDKTVCPTYYAWTKGQNPTTAPGFACCAAEALRTITFGTSTSAYPVRTYAIGLGLTSTSVGGYNNTLQCVTDIGGTGNRHFFNGNANTVAGQPAGYPASDPPPASFCSATNPCDGPGPIFPQNKPALLAAIENVLNLIQSQTAEFASAAVPSIQSNIANEAILTSFLPINQPIWPGRLDAYVQPVPVKATSVTLPDGTVTQEPLPDPTQTCTSTTQQSCHLWNAGDQILAQALAGYDTAGTNATERRVYYAPLTPIVAGERRLTFQAPAVTSTSYLYDLENAMGICGPGFTYYPPSNEADAANSPTTCPTGQIATSTQYLTLKQAINFTEEVKTYTNPTTNQPVQYILGDIFHSNPQVMQSPADPALFQGNVDSYQTFAGNNTYRRKVVFFGSNDGELHAVDAGTVQSGTLNDTAAWTFNTGTGNELFAFVPRTVMPTLSALGASYVAPSFSGAETFMVDGPPHLAEGYFDASTSGTGAQWHTLVVGGLREGGHGYYALDVTQPDALTTQTITPNGTGSIQMPSPTASNYLPSCVNGGSGCAQLAFPTPLWEFTDSCNVVPACTGSACLQKPCDEDSSGVGLGQPDLGQAWSTPDTGRIRVCDTSACTTFHEQWVVIFGGGMDPNNTNTQGNYLYMLDMATGAVIYKRALNGSVPSETAAVDTGQDGYIDTIYVGTTAGYLYKVDLTLPAPIVAITGLGNRISTSYWQPFQIFNTQGRQMYYPPAVFYIQDLNEYGLAWGTGNRQNLWLPDTTTGRFYVTVDTGFTPTTTGLPLTAANLVQLNLDTSPTTSTNYLDHPPTGDAPGYYFELNQGERVVTEAFALGGVLIFNTYEPTIATGGSGSNRVCADSGTTRVAVLNITNGNGLAASSTGGTVTLSRTFSESQALSLNITVSPETPVNPVNGGTNSNNNVGCDPTSATYQAALTQLMKLMPTNCRYSNATIPIGITLQTSATVCAVGVPICIAEKNWKEF